MEILWWNEERGRMKIRSWQLSFICLLDYFKLIFLLTQDVFLNNKSFYASGGMLKKIKHFTMFAVNLRKKNRLFLITQLTHDVNNSQY